MKGLAVVALYKRTGGSVLVHPARLARSPALPAFRRVACQHRVLISGHRAMSLDNPCVSICLPVYNGEQFIREAIDSILSQTFKDLELVISDNASTDGTNRICRDAVASDRRVRYFRSDVNRGSAWNHNRAFELANGRYVAWIGHDDLIANDYIERCAQALDKDSGAVLCYAGYNYIDERGSVVKRSPLDNPGSVANASTRFCRIIYEIGCHPGYGVMRTEALKQTALHRGIADCDRVLVAEMGFRGRFILIPAYLFHRRDHSGRVSAKHRTLRDRTLIMDPAKEGRLFFPVLLETAAFCSAIYRAKLPYGDQFRCFMTLLGWMRFMRRHDLFVEDLRERIVTTMKRFVGSRGTSIQTCQPNK
jgi:glycosyltransferase involved in cell wall biosynthesis